MTVKELIEKLGALPESADVIFEDEGLVVDIDSCEYLVGSGVVALSPQSRVGETRIIP